MQKMCVMTTVLGPVCWVLLNPVDGYGNEKDSPKGKGKMRIVTDATAPWNAVLWAVEEILSLI